MSNFMVRTARARGARWLRIIASTCLLAAGAAEAQTLLADSPLFSTVNAPGNLAMVLSVEYPTAVSVAHTNRTYSSASTYLGYFDEAKCYSYLSDSSDSTLSTGATPASYFVPSGYASSHSCTTSASTGAQWSGNFLNWASMQTIDTFRWVLTGGYRVIDTSSLTVVEKAWASGQGGTDNFPDGSIPAAAIAGATPFGALVTQGATALNFRIAGQGNQMRFYVAAPALKYNVVYFNCTDFLCSAITPSPSTVTDFSALATNTSPASGVNVNNFGARYTTTVIVPQTGLYTFGLMADDGAALYLNNSPTSIATATYANSVGVGTPNPGGSINLTAGDTLTIRTDYYQYSGGATLGLYWKLPGSSSFTQIGPPGGTLGASYLDYNGAAIAPNTTYTAFIRAKMCDASVGLETNCVAYSAGYKPEGLMQKYSNKLRYSAFGYLNDSSSLRDAGVLRAAQKFIGPQSPVYGSPPVTNLASEWDSITGVMTADPDCSSSNPDRPTDKQCPTASVNSSGVMNYINKFGELLHGGYKTYDPVSELYYAAIRYFKNLGDVPDWSADLATLAASDRNRLMDGFPVLTNPKDPIIGSCQRNFILGIGDTHTWVDKNVPGNTNTSGEPRLPDAVAADNPTGNANEISPYNAVIATNKVGAMESGGSVTNLGTQVLDSGRLNSALIAGLAYDAHTTGIRSYTDAAGNKKAQTLDTYWLDVQEGGHYEPYNQYYYAAKYGGFKVPDGYKPYDAATTTIDPSTWWNGVDYLSYNGTSNMRPNNYYSAGAPDQMQAGLVAAFADAAATSSTSYSTSFALQVPQVGPDGTASYAATYQPSTWSGDLIASKLTFDATGAPLTSTTVWSFADKLKAQAAGTGNARKIVTWNGTAGVPFELPTASPAGITTTQLSKLDTSYIAGNDAADYLQYLRGNTSHEIPSTGADATHYYRTRVGPLGDIVNSTPVVVGAPAFPYGDTSNTGYSTFKATARSTVVYVGANDGMLHAIDGSLTSATGGNELFAYVPSALFNGPNGTPSVDGLASLGNPGFVHHYMVDGPLGYFDVDYAKTPGSTTTTATWRTLLIGALGKGGKSYFAIDITSPSAMTSEAAVASKVLWEYSNAKSLGYTYGKPVVVKVRKYGWVVVLPSGYNNVDGFGHFLFLNPRTGALLEDVKTPSTSNGLAQLNAYILDSTDGTADAFYAGDLDGNLWRLDVTQTTTGNFPAPLKIASFMSPATTTLAATGQPITTVPFVQIDPTTKRRFVLVGTGRLLDTSDVSSTQTQTFYAIWDGDNTAFATAPISGSYPITRDQLLVRSASDTTSGATAIAFGTKSGWYTDLTATDTTTTPATALLPRLVSQMTASYGQVAFAATVPLGTMCSPSGSTVDYAFAYGTAQSTLLSGTLTLPNLVLSNVTTTNISYTSNNGSLELIYGVTNNSSKTQLAIKPYQAIPTRRVNWREVPLVD